MNRLSVIVFSMLAATAPALLSAAELTADEQAFFNRHTSDLVRLEPTRLDDPVLARVFSATFYAVQVVIKDADGEQSTGIKAIRLDDKLVPVGRPSTDCEPTDFLKLLNPAFRLRTDADAKALQQALDAAYPINSESDKRAETFRHAGRSWTFVRGEFFESKLGYIFETDAAGAIKSVKFTLKLP